MDYDSGVIVSEKSGDMVILMVGLNYMSVNDTIVPLDVPSREVNGRLLVPVRAIADAYGCQVDWNSSLRLVSIQSGSEQSIPGTTPQTSGSVVTYLGTTVPDMGYYTNLQLFQSGEDEESIYYAYEINAYSDTSLFFDALRKQGFVYFDDGVTDSGDEISYLSDGEYLVGLVISKDLPIVMIVIFDWDDLY